VGCKWVNSPSFATNLQGFFFFFNFFWVWKLTKGIIQNGAISLILRHMFNAKGICSKLLGPTQYILVAGGNCGRFHGAIMIICWGEL
jgi:hypothetical protein